MDNSKSCYCGQNTCAELFLSGSALEENYKELHPESQFKSAKDIFDSFKEGSDETSKKIILNYKNDLSIFLSLLTRIFDPHYFVLGGGVSLQDEIYKGLEQKVHQNSFAKDSKPLIYKHQISDSAGALGAALSTLSESHLEKQS